MSPAQRSGATEATGARGADWAVDAAGRRAIRPGAPDSFERCLAIWRAALDDYLARLNQPPIVTDSRALGRLLAHLQATDPGRFRVAELDGRLVGFGSAVVRGSWWFLALLFVEPSVQGHGIGRLLLESLLPRPGERIDALATVTDAAQPISNALYARFGLVPRLPILQLLGRPEREPLPELPAGISSVAFERAVGGPSDGAGGSRLEAALGRLDRALVGTERRADHAFLAGDGRRGVLYLGPDGEAVGYGYWSSGGQLGPAGAIDPELLPAIVGDLVRRAGEALPERPLVAVHVPGAADRLLVALLRSGLRLEGFPALACWSRPFAAFDRYVPGSLALP
ncbi:MAG TPA: GNAT family N-acetyltransferase [Candidatus Limnocylindrales bacterium]|nr:GNAT family N-acetyltransferase [Candidatus Limnocylindrales bacterium]